MIVYRVGHFPDPQLTLRLDRDVVEKLKASGPRWQTRANDALKRWLDRQEHRRVG